MVCDDASPLPNTIPPLEIRLFGAFLARVRGAPLPKLRSRQGWRLLALLALRQGRAVERSFLAGSLWPESREEDAVANLRRELTDLRRALGEEAARLQAPARNTLLLDLSGGALLDITQFDAAAGRSDPASLAQAISLYTGPFLEGCSDDWAIAERERREQVFLGLLERAAEGAMQSGDPVAAAHLLDRALAREPLREPALRALLQALAAAGDQAALVQRYQQFQRRLRRELGSDPDAVTISLYKSLRRRSSSAPSSPVPIVIPAAGPIEPSQSPASAIALPVPRTAYFGREAERAQLEMLLRTPPPFLITVTGPGGAGKTRIAVETARRVLSDFPGGVWFVPMADVPEPALLPFTLARSLRLPDKPSGDPDSDPLLPAIVWLRSRIAEERRGLLVLDNAEHLLRGEASSCLPEGGLVGIVLRLLDDVPGLTCLVTSRQPLGLSEEQEFPLVALELPPDDMGNASEAALLSIGSVALYVDRAQAVRPQLPLTKRNLAAICALCRRLEGMPLAIELAASWARTLTPEQMLTRLTSQLDLMSQRMRDQPARHQSLRAVFESSYDQLSAELRSLFARLSVFRGGWTLEMLEAMESASQGSALHSLTELQARSLVLAEETDEEDGFRYRLLEPLRELAAEKLTASGEAAEVRQRHASTFRDHAIEVSAHLNGPEASRWLDRLEREHDNLRAALQWYGESQDGAESGLRLVTALQAFWDMRGYYREGRLRFLQILAHPGAQEPSATRAASLMGAGRMEFFLGEYDRCRALIKEALTIWHALGDEPGIARCLSVLGTLAKHQNDLPAAQAFYEEALPRLRKIGDPGPLGILLMNLGTALSAGGDYAAARLCYDESLALRRSMGDRYGAAATLINLGSLTYQQGDTDAAHRYMIEGLTLCLELKEKRHAADALDMLGSFALQAGHHERAARLLGVAFALHTANGSFPGFTEEERNAFRGQLRAALGEPGFTAAYEEGQRMTLEEAVHFAQHLVPRE